MGKEVEIITSVDAYGDWDVGAHVLKKGQIISYGPGPDDHVLVEELANKLRQLKAIEKLQSTHNWDGAAWIPRVANEDRG